jgi:predicted N-formylglutamate amidohydrolase
MAVERRLVLTPHAASGMMAKTKGVMNSILNAGEAHPADVKNEGGASPFLLICEHASNTVPETLGTLGLQPGDLERHIAYDIGAAGVTRALSQLLDCTAVLQNYSRLVYDCNRPPEAPGAMPAKSEIFDVPGNVGLSGEQKAARIRDIYRPFMRKLDDVIDARTCRGQQTIAVSIHSFTKTYFGKERAVEVGLLVDRDPWLGERLAHSFPEFVTRLNEPYGPADGVMHLMNQIAAPRGLNHLMLEIRNDLIAHKGQQQEWAKRLSVPLKNAATHLGGQ